MFSRSSLIPTSRDVVGDKNAGITSIILDKNVLGFHAKICNQPHFFSQVGEKHLIRDNYMEKV